MFQAPVRPTLALDGREAMTPTTSAVTTAAALVCLIAGAASPQPAPSVGTPEALQARIEALRPSKLVWREIRWNRCLLDGLRQSREQVKPVLLWAFINPDPTAERC